MGFNISVGRLSAYFLAIILLSSCVEDDQTNIKPEHFKIANPSPISRDGNATTFAQNNAAHKVIVAVFDTGVDYNHPFLRDNIHYALDAAGNPTGAGWDFLANDGWASQRVVRTSSYEFYALSERQQKQALLKYKTEGLYNDFVRRNKLGRVCAEKEILKIDPRLSRYMEPYRDIATEAGNLRHGTHVAGLMTYDNPAIGIIPYRVLPYYESEADELDAATGKVDRFATNFETALAHARANNVRVVNLSLGDSFKKPVDTNDASYEEDFEKYKQYKRLLLDRMSSIVKNYSEILFVAAAGNDAGWSDNETRLQYPCGIEAPNILCVGALNKDRSFAQFTNLPLNKIDLVLASGVDIISTLPSDNCQQFRVLFDTLMVPGSKDEGICKYDVKQKEWIADDAFIEQKQAFLKVAYDACNHPRNLLGKMSGTSMAAPIVSRMAAEIFIEHPTDSPAAVIAALKTAAEVDQKRQFTTYLLREKTPQWNAILDDSPKKAELRPVAFREAFPQAFQFVTDLSGSRGEKSQAQARASVKRWFEFIVAGK